jgi:hypothetical protein
VGDEHRVRRLQNLGLSGKMTTGQNVAVRTRHCGIGVSPEAAVQVPVLQRLNADQIEHTTARLTLPWAG